MKKRMLSLMIALVMVVSLLPMAVFADDPVAQVGNQTYTTLSAAISAIQKGESGTVTLLSDVFNLDSFYIANKHVTLDLNNHNITFNPSRHIFVYGTDKDVTLNVTGSGTIKSSLMSSEYYPTIQIEGFNNATNKAVVTIGKDVTIASDGSYGMALYGPYGTGNCAAGVTINVNGTIAAPYGFSASGNIKDTTEGNTPVFNLNETGKITGYNGQTCVTPVYAAGYAEYNIGGTLEGTSSGIAIKSGTLNVKSTASVSCVGEYLAPTEPYDNGVNPSGSAIQIEGHSGYAGNIKVNVEDGATVKSTNGNAIYQYAENEASEVKVSNINITGGNFTSGDGEDTIVVDTVAEENEKIVVSGGKFSEPVKPTYLDSSLNYEAHDGEMYSYHTNIDDAQEAAGDTGNVDTISPDSGSGTGEHTITLKNGESTLELHLDTDEKFTLRRLSRSGYTFLGWSDGEKTYAGGAEYTVTGDATLVAQWIPNAIIGGISQIITGAGSMMQHFVDVTSMDYYFDAVQWAVEHGITEGTGKVTFSPDAPCTRAQAVTFLWRALGCPKADKAASFTDVKYGSYYADAVAWAVEKGITNGTSDTTFSPDAPCTRAQIVTFLYRAIGTQSTVEAGFSDVPASAYYADAVNWAAQYGITGGTGANKFSPNATCTRAQIVTFLYRAK